MPGKTASKHILDIRFRPDARFLDKRGAVVEDLTPPATAFNRWSVSADRIDFTRDGNRHIRAFFSHRSLGVISTPPNGTTYFVEVAEAFITAAWTHIPNRDFSRAALRSALFIETERFEKALAAYRTRFLGLADEDVKAFGGNLIDVGFPMNFTDRKDHFNVITGPMERAQAQQLLSDTPRLPGIVLEGIGLLHGRDADASDLPAVGIYVDVDFFRTDFPERTTAGTMRDLLRRGIRKAQAVAGLIGNWILEED